MEKYFTVEKDYKFYRSRGQWVGYLHDAAHMTEELAQRISRRYSGSTVETNFGYDVHYRMVLADVGEPETQAALASAVRLAKRDGLTLPTILVQVEKSFHEDAKVSHKFKEVKAA